MCEPNDDWPCKFDDSPEVGRSNTDLFPKEDCGTAEPSCNGETEFTFPSEAPNEALADDDEEVTESKIQAFLDEKVKIVYGISYSVCNWLLDCNYSESHQQYCFVVLFLELLRLLISKNCKKSSIIR